MAVYGSRYNAFTPDSVQDAGSVGIRRSVQRILDLIDMTDPAWPGVVAVLREFTEAGVELDEVTVAAAVKLGRQRGTTAAQRVADASQNTLATAVGSIVYYIRRGNLIKIGTTTNPRKRFDVLMPDEILAVEPGGYSLETARHSQFDHLRMRPKGEYFRDEPELRQHIKDILAMYGEPDTSWPSTGPRPSRAAHLPLIVEKQNDVLTAAEAEKELGVRRDTIYSWVGRKRIQPVGRNDQDLQVFNRDHLLKLRATTRRYRARILTPSA